MLITSPPWYCSLLITGKHLIAPYVPIKHVFLAWASTLSFIFINTFKSIFHALMGKTQLELFIFITFFFHCHPIQCCVFFLVGILSLMQHSQQVLYGVEVSSVSWLGQLTVGVQITDYFNC